MSILADLKSLIRFSRSLKPFLRDRLSVNQAETFVQERMERREALFLEAAGRAMNSMPRNPYRQLFEHAGCERGDVENLVRRDGIEGALHALARAGVYLTFHEFKGRIPAVRGSRTFHFRDEDFHNPRTIRHFYGQSSGSRGTPTQTPAGLDHVAESAPHWALLFDAHKLMDCTMSFWTPGHPGVASRHLMCAKFNKPFHAWFIMEPLKTPRGRLAAAAVHGLKRRAGNFPPGRIVPLNQAGVVAEYLLGLLDEGRKPCMNATPSAAIRACREAQRRGRTIEGVSFLLAAEPATEARKKAIEECGARGIATYGFSEGGGVGGQCANPTAADDTHVFMDAFAVISGESLPREIGPPDGLLFTSLRRSCPKILFNTQIGDSAVIENRECGCPLGRFGYTQHIRTIRSFEKLTGEGMTVRAADLYPILESVLPRRFGGAPGDYQLVEEQDADGIARMELRIAPDAGEVVERAALNAFYDELKRTSIHYRLMAEVWRQTGNLRTARKPPLVTQAGKTLPVRIVHS